MSGARPLSVVTPEETSMADSPKAPGAETPHRDPGRPLDDPGRPLGGPGEAASADARQPGRSDEGLSKPIQQDNELQADPILTEGRASAQRMTAFAFAIVVVIGTLFYAMNTGSNAPGGGTDSKAPIISGAAPAPSNNKAPGN
jgi:hypothetical protein